MKDIRENTTIIDNMSGELSSRHEMVDRTTSIVEQVEDLRKDLIRLAQVIRYDSSEEIKQTRLDIIDARVRVLENDIYKEASRIHAQSQLLNLYALGRQDDYSDVVEQDDDREAEDEKIADVENSLSVLVPRIQQLRVEIEQLFIRISDLRGLQTRCRTKKMQHMEKYKCVLCRVQLKLCFHACPRCENYFCDKCVLPKIYLKHLCPVCSVRIKVPLKGGNSSKKLKNSSQQGDDAKETKASSQQGDDAKETKVSSQQGDDAKETKASSQQGDDAKETKVSSQQGDDAKETKVSSQGGNDSKKIKVSPKIGKFSRELKRLLE